MSKSGNLFRRSADLVMLQKGLLHPEEITLLDDGEILRCPGVGRKALNALREVYPFDRETVETAEAIVLNKKLFTSRERLASGLHRPHLKFGDIHHVEAARIVDGNLMIKVRGHRELVPILLQWWPSLKKEDIPEGEGFGLYPTNGLVRIGLSFPILRDVHRVKFTDLQNYDDYWAAHVHIIADQATFEIGLYGDEEDATGHHDNSNQVSFGEEIQQDLQLQEIHKKLEISWESVTKALLAGSEKKALKSISSVAEEIKGLMQTTIERAKPRGFTVVDEHFCLTATDHPDLNYDINDGETFEWGEFFPSGDGPLHLVGCILRQLLEKKPPIEIIEATSFLDSLQIPNLNFGLKLYNTIASEINQLEARLNAAGKDGILRKNIIANIDDRFIDDGGIVRRAIKRWIQASVERGEILVVSSRQGQVLRMSFAKP